MHLTNLRVRPMKQTSKRASLALYVHTASIAENLRHRHIISPADTCAKPHKRNSTDPELERRQKSGEKCAVRESER